MNNALKQSSSPIQLNWAKDLLDKCLKNWFLFVLSGFIALSLGFLYLKMTIPQYKSSASILIKQEKSPSQTGEKENVMNELDMFSDARVLDNEIEKIKAKVIMDRVVNDLGLYASYYTSEDKGFKGLITKPWHKHELYDDSPIRFSLLKFPENNEAFTFNITPLSTETYKITTEQGSKVQSFGKTFTLQGMQYVVYPTSTIKSFLNNDIQVKVALPLNVVDSYLLKLKVKISGKGGSVLSLTILDPVPERGKDILNKTIEEYNRSVLLAKNKEATAALAFIDDRLKLITGELSSAEKAVEEYKTDKEITDISSQSQLLLNKIKENDSQLNSVNIQLNVMQSVTDYLSSNAGGRGASGIIGVDDPVLQNKLNKLNDLELERTRLLRTMNEGNPIIEGLNSQISSTKTSINDNIQAVRRGLVITRNNLQSNNSGFESAVRTVPQKERQLINIERQKNIKEELYVYLLQKREETALSYAAQFPESELVDAPSSGTDPESPQKVIVVFLSMVMGLLAPIVFFGIKDFLNDKVLNRQVIESTTNAPILGVIGKNNTNEKLVVKQGSRTAISEQFRFLRTNLQYLDHEQKNQTILVTSSIPDEGKSFISANLGASLSISGKKTLILEMDLRKPGLAKMFDVVAEKGISNLIRGEVTLEEVIQPSRTYETLDIVTCGTTADNPAELLLDKRLADLFEFLKKRYDYIIIDSPPVGLVTDALILERFADMSIYVIRYGYTHIFNLKLISDVHKNGKFKNMGLIFNGVNLQDSKEYAYSYSNGYYYDNPKQKGIMKRLKNS
ncbi:capsular biosynthesis protein [Solitalea longa]|uniref:non-specific protein-tyrosine kinase n=1 Tax=Solitalea longa TaxID=2079460 RepID=A0A2S4ZZS6_9SPHI|nr:tyrosine-protein kinase [Solitalea longa]POY35794.1 capsular biosynthesis protein [Solitalea longa]